jgi:hypothetical protein
MPEDVLDLETLFDNVTTGVVYIHHFHILHCNIDIYMYIRTSSSSSYMYYTPPSHWNPLLHFLFLPFILGR